MRIRYKVLFVSVGPVTTLFAQEAPIPAKQATGRRLIGERDKAKEDKVVRLFETIRIDAKLPRLKRIRHRDSLEQQVCTVTVNGETPKKSMPDTFALYKTVNLESIPSELRQVASFDDDRFPRYSISVWRVREVQTREVAYWVGIERYRSSAFEFFDNHSTDDIYYHNDWKKNVVPECRGK